MKKNNILPKALISLSILLSSTAFAEQISITPTAVYKALQQEAPAMLGVAPNQELSLDFINKVLTKLGRADYHWSCKVVKQDSSLDPKIQGGVIWTQLSCQGKYPAGVPFLAGKSFGPIITNLVDANLSDPNVSITPVLAEPGKGKWYYTQPVGPSPQHPEWSSMAEADPEHRIAGINGGYFFENSQQDTSFFDTNCIWKRAPQTTPAGVGDGLLMIDGKTYSKNCPILKKLPIPRRATFTISKKGEYTISNILPSITPLGLAEGLGAGPALIDSKSGKAEVNMQWQFITSTFEYSANTAFALAEDSKGKQHAILFTVDGNDRSSGMFSFQMANFLYVMIPRLTQYKLVSAMSMDQGGSTTMYVKGYGVVSKADDSGKVRSVYNGLFVTLK